MTAKVGRTTVAEQHRRNKISHYSCGGGKAPPATAKLVQALQLLQYPGWTWGWMFLPSVFMRVLFNIKHAHTNIAGMSN